MSLGEAIDLGVNGWAFISGLASLSLWAWHASRTRRWLRVAVLCVWGMILALAALAALGFYLQASGRT